jgi:hypothetical protein
MQIFKRGHIWSTPYPITCNLNDDASYYPGGSAVVGAVLQNHKGDTWSGCWSGSPKSYPENEINTDVTRHAHYQPERK